MVMSSDPFHASCPLDPLVRLDGSMETVKDTLTSFVPGSSLAMSELATS